MPLFELAEGARQVVGEDLVAKLDDVRPVRVDAPRLLVDLADGQAPPLQVPGRNLADAPREVEDEVAAGRPRGHLEFEKLPLGRLGLDRHLEGVARRVGHPQPVLDRRATGERGLGPYEGDDEPEERGELARPCHRSGTTASRSAVVSRRPAATSASRSASSTASRCAYTSARRTAGSCQRRGALGRLGARPRRRLPGKELLHHQAHLLERPESAVGEALEQPGAVEVEQLVDAGALFGHEPGAFGREPADGLGRLDRRPHADERAGFVEQVDGFVGLAPQRNALGGEAHGVAEDVVRDRKQVVDFQAGPARLEHFEGLLGRKLQDVDRLKRRSRAASGRIQRSNSWRVVAPMTRRVPRVRAGLTCWPRPSAAPSTSPLPSGCASRR